ncbi:MAG: efflux RND transporter periplasmic adaptor subunit [bacterium]
MKRLAIILGIILTVSAVIVYYWKGSRAEKGEGEQRLTRVEVMRGTIAKEVYSTGRVVPNLDVEIKCKASGEVVSLPYDVSDEVRKGDLLVELDPTDEQRQVDQAGISLSASEARLRQAQLEVQRAEDALALEERRSAEALKSARANAEFASVRLERQKQLLDKRLISQEEFDSAETAAIQAAADLEKARIQMEELKVQGFDLQRKQQDVRLAKAQVESDRISLSMARQRLEDTKVFAPIDGVVSSRNVQIGQIISSGITNVSGGTTVMTLSDLSHIFVLASVDESDIGSVAVGQRAVITVDAFPEKEFQGKVVRIATKGENVSNVVTFEVKLEVMDEERHALKPEMTANVEVIIARQENALLIPFEAVFRKNGSYMVETADGGSGAKERPVEIGINNGVMVQVTGGLEQGDAVMVKGEEQAGAWQASGGGRSWRHLRRR